MTGRFEVAPARSVLVVGSPGLARALEVQDLPVKSVDAILLLFERLAQALQAAHEAGVTHRDVNDGHVERLLDVLARAS